MGEWTQGPCCKAALPPTHLNLWEEVHGVLSSGGVTQQAQSPPGAGESGEQEQAWNSHQVPCQGAL